MKKVTSIIMAMVLTVFLAIHTASAEEEGEATLQGKYGIHMYGLVSTETVVETKYFEYVYGLLNAGQMMSAGSTIWNYPGGVSVLLIADFPTLVYYQNGYVCTTIGAYPEIADSGSGSTGTHVYVLSSSTNDADMTYSGYIPQGFTAAQAKALGTLVWTNPNKMDIYIYQNLPVFIYYKNGVACTIVVCANSIY